MSIDMNSDNLYCLFEQFHEKIKSATDKAEYIMKLMESVPLLLRKYPSELSVMETICKAIVQAALIQHGNNVPDSNGLDVTASLVGALSEVHWESQSIPFVRLASESVIRLLVLYDQTKSFNSILELVMSFVRTLFTRLESSPKSLIALGGSFPSDLPESVYFALVDGVHDKIQNLVTMYADMSEADLSNILVVLQRFAKAAPSCAYTYTADSTSFFLLFAAQQFCNSDVIQVSLWNLLTIIIRVDPEYTTEVDPDVLIPAILPTISNTTCNRIPIVEFLIEYSSVPNREPLLVISCLVDYPELLQVLLQLLDTSRELESEKQREEVAAVSDLLEMFFWKFRDHLTVKFIARYHILDFLKQAAIKWPDLCCLSYCTAIRRFLDHFSHQGSSSLELTEFAFPQEKNIFFSENQLLPFVELLCSPETFVLEEIRSAIYDTVLFLLRSTPEVTMKNEWLTYEFLSSFSSSLPQDVMLFRNKLHVFMFTAHFILYNLENDRMQVIRAQEWHDMAIHCLSLADSHEARTICIGFATSILHGYSQSIKDISPFYNSNFPHLILDFAKQFGFGVNSEAGKTFSFLILTLTANRQASIVLHKNDILEDLYPFIQDQYDPQIVQPAVHAIGNIALSGDHIKKEILDKGFHITLINYLTSNMAMASFSMLSACCRVLHVLAFDKWAKHKLAEEGLVNILMKMLDSRRDNAEVCWRPLGLLSSLGFMSSLSNQEYIISEKVIKSLLRALKTAEHNEEKSCNTALVFLASIDNERSVDSTYRMKVTEIFQQRLLQEECKPDFHCNFLQKWDSFSSEKGRLFTIPLNNGPLGPEEEQLVASCMVQCITWPETPPPPIVPKELIYSNDVSLPLHDKFLPPPAQFPEADKLTDDAVSQIFQLGLNPDSLFRVKRFHGSKHGRYKSRFSEISFSPQSLTPNQYQELITRGWYRRGGVNLYRHSYDHNVDRNDWETRVLVSEFDHKKHKSYKKILRKMPEDRLTIETVPTQFISEAHELYSSYHIVQHGRLCATSESGYCNHAVNSVVRNQSVNGFQYGSFHQLYRLDGKLVAVGVIDIVPNGVVSVYMWYDTSKEIAKFSFGIYSTLKEIEFARELSKCNPNIKYYYLQGWNGSNQKYSYKAKYEPEEFYSPCTALNWVLGLDGVQKAKEELKEKWLLTNNQATSISDSDSFIVDGECNDDGNIPGDALSLDLVRYKMETGLDKPDIMKVVVCLNHQIYIYLGHMLDAYSTSSYQRNQIVEEFEELVLAVGPKLTENMVVELGVCPDTGKLEGYVDYYDY